MPCKLGDPRACKPRPGSSMFQGPRGVEMLRDFRGGYIPSIRMPRLMADSGETGLEGQMKG